MDSNEKENSNNSIFKCHICGTLLSFDFYVENNEFIIFYSCVNGHKNKSKLIDFMRKSHICKRGKKIYQNETCCSIHYSDKSLYCKNCEKKICNKCEQKHKEHIIVDLNKYFFTLQEQKDLISSLLEIEKKIIKLEQLKNDILTYLNKIIESNFLMLSFSRQYLLSSLKEKYLNFYNIKNFKLLKSFYQPTKTKIFEQIIQLGEKFLSSFNLTFQNDLICKNSLTSHKNYIYTLNILSDGRLISCSSDNLIKIYNTNYEVDYILNIHSGSVYYISQLNSGNLISCSRDKTIKIIKLLDNHKYNIEQTLEGHNYAVEKVIEPKNNFLASVSYDKYLRIWEKKDLNYELIKSTQFQTATSDSGLFKINDNEFLTISIVNKSIQFWTTEYFTCFSTIKNIKTQFSTSNVIKVNKDLLCIGGIDLVSFYLIKLSTHQLLLNINNNMKILSMVKCIDGNFWVGYETNNLNQYIAKYKYDGVSLIKIMDIKYNLNYSISSITELKDGSLAIGNREGVIQILK